jgi:hypothetical protein
MRNSWFEQGRNVMVGTGGARAGRGKLRLRKLRLLARVVTVIAATMVYTGVFHLAPAVQDSALAGPPCAVDDGESTEVRPPYADQERQPEVTPPTHSADSEPPEVTPPMRSADSEPFMALFVAHHQLGTPLIESKFLKHIQAGYAISDTDFGLPLNDANGKNISHRREEFNDLTCLYWVYQNYDLARHEFVGHMQYRRYFNFQVLLDQYESVMLKRFVTGNEYLGVKGLELNDTAMAEQMRALENDNNTAKVRNILWQFDIVVTPPLNYPQWDGDQELLPLVALMYPIIVEFAGQAAAAESFLNITEGPPGSYHNMVLASSAVFRHYCEWLFALLFRIETSALIAGPDFDRVGWPRLMSHISERMQNVYLYAHPELRLLHLPHSFLNTDPHGQLNLTKVA